MKFKKLIAVLLIMSIMFTSISPVSFAVYTYSENETSHILNWTELKGGITNQGTKLETIEIQVEQDGIYNVSNVMGGNVSAQFVICGDIDNKGGLIQLNSLAPLPVATYASNGEATMDISAYNNAASKSTSVYLKAGQTYYICMTGEDGNSLHSKSPSESTTLAVNVKYIPPREGDVAFETERSSIDYTASIATRNTWITSDSTKYIYANDLSTSLQTISGDEINMELNAGANASNVSQNAAWYEQILTWFVLLISDGIRAAVSGALGSDLSIDNMLFNEYSNTRLSIFGSSQTGNKSNGFLQDSGLIDANGKEGILTRYFVLFRNIAIAVYIVILLYMGIRILLASTGSKKEKYKSMLSDWVKGIIILASFQYVMKYAIVINDGIVDYLSELRLTLPGQTSLPTLSGVSDELSSAMGLVNSNISSNGDIMETMRGYAAQTGRLAYAMIYLFLIKQLLGFVYIYFKRLISVLFLIVIFPVVTISYAIDKIKDGKSQVFDNWLKEFLLNVFIQSFQAINYIVVMSIIFALTTSGGVPNVILVMVGLEYISNGDKLLRSMFSKVSGSAGTLPGSLKEAVKTVATVKMAKSLTKKISTTGSRVSNFRESIRNVKNSYYDLQESRYNQKIANKQAADAAWELSRLNPERLAIEDVAGNIQKAFNLSNARTPQEVKDALDRLLIARRDPLLKAIFDSAYGALSEADQINLDALMQLNEGINATLDGQQGVQGPLTEREININANLFVNMNANKNSGLYRDLYAYTKSKNITDANGGLILDGAGSPFTLNDYLTGFANTRQLNNDEQNRFSNAQKFIGDVTGIDSSEMGTKRVQSSSRIRNTSYTKLDTEGKTEAERASNLARRMQSIYNDIQSGRRSNCSATEAMELAKEWQSLAASSDTNVISEIDSFSSMVGFSLDEFVTMASLAVVSDKNNLVGTNEEKQKMFDEALDNLVEVENMQISDGSTEEERSRIKVMKNMVSRSENDDLIARKQSGESIRLDRYIRTKATQEDIRDSKMQAARMRAIHTDRESSSRMTVAEARGNLIRNSVKAAGATASIAATPISFVTGTASAGLITGLSGEANPIEILGAADFGIGLEHSIESAVPGTVYSTEKSVGGKLDNFANKKIKSTFGLSSSQKNQEFMNRQRLNNSLKAKNDTYKKYLR
ncbi:MAG: hypothetical protein IJ272_05120 [Clostridia bacterium]|nr:hypothetical protein [Clostridia bacterium]